MKHCKSDGCNEPTHNRGWCSKHFSGTVKISINMVLSEKREVALATQKRFDILMAKRSN